MVKWFSLEWWQYLLIGCTGWENFWCRARGHNAGVYYYSANGSEPDMRCLCCGEDLG